MEKVLQVPFGLVGPLYYKRTLNCFNLCIHSIGDGKGYCHFWHGTIGQKGSSEVATILLMYLDSLPNHVEHVVFYCDTCGGQNRNAGVVSALNYYKMNTHRSISTIDLKFMESGHSPMEVDSMHAVIESQKTFAEVFLPTEWVNVFRRARPERPYTVTVMGHTDFLDFKEFAKASLKNTKKDKKGKQVYWLKTKWFQFKKDQPDIVFFKENTDAAV